MEESVYFPSSAAVSSGEVSGSGAFFSAGNNDNSE